MRANQEDVIRVHAVPRTDADGVVSSATPVSNERLIVLGAANVRIEGTYAKRTIPPPWVDCEACARRYYPSTIAGRWHIATTCLSCGAAIPGPK